MRKNMRTAFLVSLFSALAGCAGRNFVRPTPEAIKLGRTTYPQVIQQMGEPKKVGEVLKNGCKIKTISYAYAASVGEPLEEGVIPARALTYYFYNDAVVGQEFISSFKSDSTNFDDNKIGSIVKGKTSRAEVIQLLGNPFASFIPPMVKETPREAVGYSYVTTRGGPFTGFKIFRKTLKITFDEKDQVSDVDYSSSGDR